MSTPITESHTFVGEVDGQPGHGYAGYIKGQRYQLQVLRLANDTVEIKCAAFSAQGLLLSTNLFKRWWQPV